MRALRRTKTFPDGWKLTFSELTNIHHSNQAISDAMAKYMYGTKHHDIRNLERAVMNEFEEQKIMARFDYCSIRFRWTCISKQHVSPFAERFAFAIYSGKKLLAAVFESENLRGFGVEREDYEAI